MNAAFLFSAFGGATLDNITLAAGQGQDILRRTLADAKRFTGVHPRPQGEATVFQPWRRAPRPVSKLDNYFKL